MEQSGFLTQLGEPLFTSVTVNIQVLYVYKFKIVYNKHLQKKSSSTKRVQLGMS